MKAKYKLLLKVFVTLLFLALLAFYLYGANRRACYHFVEDLNYNCAGIGDLTNYINYDMLSGDLKTLISKENFKFSTTEEKLQFCRLISSFDYEYEADPNDVYSTDQIGRNDLAQRITVDGKEYIISVSITFKLGWFYTAKIVDLDASVLDLDTPDWKDWFNLRSKHRIYNSCVFFKNPLSIRKIFL